MTRLARERRPELMDRPDAPVAELTRSLADLRAVNRWLGGTRALLAALAPMVRRLRERPVRVLDVATGSADIPLALVRWAGRRGEALQVTATDSHPRTVAIARARTAHEPRVRVLPADALALPFDDGAFHFAICATALHHFPEEEAARVLREMDRVASHGIVVSDLRRSYAVLLGVRLLAATVWRAHPMTRHDGPASVRAAFTAAELRRLAARAGLEGARVGNWLFPRLGLVVDRTGEDAG